MKIYLTLSLISMLVFGVTNKNTLKEDLKIKEYQITDMQCKIDSLQSELNNINIAYLQSPLKKDIKINSKFGSRKDPIHGNIRHHNGIDIKSNDKFIRASNNGTCKIDTNIRDCNGLSIEIKNDKYLTKYFHLSKILVKNNQEVKKGDIIGIIGSTGKSTGTHLHYEVYVDNKIIDPLTIPYIID
jgi:murein DD-endopeptidase MepM/ murein hydrolase activator NlpD